MRRLVTIGVQGLLGQFDHEITIQPDWNFLILHGPNGVGKTRLLELIAHTFQLRVQRLLQSPFRSATFAFSDGTELSVEKELLIHASDSQSKNPDGSTGSETVVVYRLSGLTDEVVVWVASSSPTASVPRTVIHELDRYVPVEQVGPDTWEDRRTGEYLSPAEVLERYSEDLPFDVYQDNPIPPHLRQFINEFDVHLIETQRLLAFGDFRRIHTSARTRRLQRTPTVMQFAEDLTHRIRTALARNSRTSQELDRSFPRRVMSRQPPAHVTDEHIRERYQKQLDLRGRLADIAVLDPSGELPLPDKELEPWERRVLWTYLEDSDRKLATFSDLLSRVNLLREIVNSRFLFKELVIDAERGFRFLSRDEDRSEIGPSALSSGEQHELVLFYDLLFNVQGNSLVLIDEPEISLHVTWQQEFLNDIQKVAALGDLRFIVATHSPQVIHTWWSRTYPLYTPPGEQSHA
jgi:hypothetical protein